MRKHLIVLAVVSLLPTLTLMARGGEGFGGDGGESYGGDRGYGNDNGRGYGSYGYGGYGAWGYINPEPDPGSQPGITDDTDALYDLYLKGNGHVPSVPVD